MFGCAWTFFLASTPGDRPFWMPCWLPRVGCPLGRRPGCLFGGPPVVFLAFPVAAPSVEPTSRQYANAAGVGGSGRDWRPYTRKPPLCFPKCYVLAKLFSTYVWIPPLLGYRSRGLMTGQGDAQACHNASSQQNSLQSCTM